jgi:hypothetical protein
LRNESVWLELEATGKCEANMRAVLVFVSLSLSNASLAAAQNPPVKRLSQPQAEYAEPFTDIGAIRELSDGRVIVVDARELTVKLVDFRTGAATTIGRSGEGPGEYRWPSRLYALSGDSTLLHDGANGRLMIIQPDGKPGGFYDPNEVQTDSGSARLRRFNLRSSDGRRFLYGEAQPIRIGANGAMELADHAAIERLEFSSKKRDTIGFWPVRKDANARLIPGAGVVTQPRMDAWPVWEHWLVSPSGRIAFVFPDPYRVDFVDATGKVTQNPPIPYERVRVDDALKKQHEAERTAPQMAMTYSRGGGSSMQLMRSPYRPPASWPEFLPPYRGTGQFAPDGHLWISRMTAAGRPPLYDVIGGDGRLLERVELPPRTKLIGFGAKSVYVIRLDPDDLQYLQRYTLPTTARP